MIDVRCSRCAAPLTEPGGLAFSPPQAAVASTDTVRKFHLCAPCWGAFERWIAQRAEGAR